jgi:hypothetical protein
MNLSKAPTNVQVLKAIGATLGIAGICHGAALAAGTFILSYSPMRTYMGLGLIETLAKVLREHLRELLYFGAAFLLYFPSFLPFVQDTSPTP